MLKETNVPDGIYFRKYGDYNPEPYPVWRYHKILEPIVVHDTAEDEEKKVLGYEPMWAPQTANNAPINWYWDLEDLSPKQLCVYAQEEFDVNLPQEAHQEHLFKVILQLARFAPQNRDRMVLMAHTIKMNYDETLEEIRRMVSGTAMETVTEIITKVIER